MVNTMTLPLPSDLPDLHRLSVENAWKAPPLAKPAGLAVLQPVLQEALRVSKTAGAQVDEKALVSTLLTVFGELQSLQGALGDCTLPLLAKMLKCASSAARADVPADPWRDAESPWNGSGSIWRDEPKVPLRDPFEASTDVESARASLRADSQTFEPREEREERAEWSSRPAVVHWGQRLDAPRVEPTWAPDAWTAERETTPPNEVTLMLRNIPNKYTRGMLWEDLCAKGYRPAIDFLYLPSDFSNKGCNLGYAFLNFRDGEAAARFVREYDGGRLSRFPQSLKVLAVQPARVQGLLANVQRFRNSPVMSQPEEFQPVIFDFHGEPRSFPPPTAELPPVGPRRRAGSAADH